MQIICISWGSSDAPLVAAVTHLGSKEVAVALRLIVSIPMAAGNVRSPPSAPRRVGHRAGPRTYLPDFIESPEVFAAAFPGWASKEHSR